MKNFRPVGILLILVLILLGLVQAAQPLSLGANDDDEAASERGRSLTAAIANSGVGGPGRYAVATDTPQFVLLSFDGSKSVAMLRETLDFQQQLAAEAKPLHFTYFINAAYFLAGADTNLYQAPGRRAGLSNIGFSNNAEDISRRVAAFNEAAQAGNEIGSHSTGHFDGSRWSVAEWQQEFNSFQNILSRQAWTFPLSDISGFRAPLLAINDNLYQVLRANNFSYDTSGTASGRDWPMKDRYGLWRIPLGTVRIGSNRNYVLAMDYNLWSYQTQSQNRLIRNTPAWNEALADVVAAYRDYFTTNYHGSRAPIVIGDHFSKWNDGLYWEALKSFATEVCGQPLVRCTTFKEFVDYLNTVGPPAKLR